MIDNLKHSDEEEMDISDNHKELFDRTDCLLGIICLTALSGILFGDLFEDFDDEV